jgi:hypothetical protein
MAPLKQHMLKRNGLADLVRAKMTSEQINQSIRLEKNSHIYTSKVYEEIMTPTFL